MPTATRPPTEPYPANLRELLLRGEAGDESALPAIREAFDAHPELASFLGDLARRAEEALLKLAAGTDLTSREATRRVLASLKEELRAETDSALEVLLADRIALNWLAVHQADCDLTRRLATGAGDTPADRAALKRLDRAQARFLAACRALATTKRLLGRPAKGPSPLELLNKVVPESPSGKATRVRRTRTDIFAPAGLS